MTLRATLATLAAGLLFGLGCSGDKPGGDTTPPPPSCIDGDQDGIDSCSDCDDNDPNTAPGKPEKCDGKDNDCDGLVDEGGQCAAPGKDAGTPGPDAGQPGQDAGTPGPDAGTGTDGGTCGDTQSDPSNCGQCGKVCPTPQNAAALCVKGVCGRSACAAGKFDFDGPTTFGCEASCTGTSCTLANGTTVTLTVPPVPEGGAGFHAASAGSTFGSLMQTSAKNTNFSVVGEPALGAAAGPVQKGGNYQHLGGFSTGMSK